MVVKTVTLEVEPIRVSWDEFLNPDPKQTGAFLPLFYSLGEPEEGESVLALHLSDYQISLVLIGPIQGSVEQNDCEDIGGYYQIKPHEDDSRIRRLKKIQGLKIAPVDYPKHTTNS